MRTEDYIISGLLVGMVGVALGSVGCAPSGDKVTIEATGGATDTGGASTSGAGGTAGSTVGSTLPSGGKLGQGGGVVGQGGGVVGQGGGVVGQGGSVLGQGGGLLGQGGGMLGSGGTLGRGGGVGAGGNAASTCVAGVQTGSTCNPAVDTEECVRSNRTCTCAGTTWTCVSDTDGMGGGPGGVGGGPAGVGGGPGSGGADGLGGAASGGSSGTSLDCDASMPSGSGTTHCGSYRTGKAGNLSWELWSNAYSGDACITYYDTPAFSAKWNNNNDFLARVGIEWGGKSIAALGEVTAEFTYNKSGTSGGYSYIGIYGWATSPCVEWYIIDDSFNGMPFSPWNMSEKGSATIDGEVYKFYSGMTGGTGGNRCGTSGQFNQYWSVRQTGRSCGVITITKHFEEWKNAGMSMDNILEAKVLVESGGGQGSIEFPIANVKASNAH